MDLAPAAIQRLLISCRIRFSPHDFLEALASLMARAGFPHGDVDSESRSWGQKLPPLGSAAENGSRRDGVLRVDGASRRWEHRRRYGDFVKRARAKIFWVVVVEFAVGLFAPRTPAAASGAGSGGA